MMGKNETSKAPKAKILTKNKKLGGKKENISIIKIKKHWKSLSLYQPLNLLLNLFYK